MDDDSYKLVVANCIVGIDRGRNSLWHLPRPTSGQLDPIEALRHS